MAKRRGSRGSGPGMHPFEGSGFPNTGGADVTWKPRGPYRVAPKSQKIFPGIGIGVSARSPSAPGKAARPNLYGAGSMRAAVRSPTPTSIQNSGRSYYGDLSYSSDRSENRPYATGGMGTGGRSRKPR